MKKYELGQSVFVLVENGQSIIPGIVSDIVEHRKIGGSDINYMITFGPEGKQKVLNLKEIKGELFSSLNDLEKTLFDRMKKIIDELITETKTKTLKWYGVINNSSTKEEEKPTSDEESSLSPEELKQKLREMVKIKEDNDEESESVITLEDGKRIKIKNNILL